MNRDQRINALAGELIGQLSGRHSLTKSDAVMIVAVTRRHVEEIKNEPRRRRKFFYVLKTGASYITNGSNGTYTLDQTLASRFATRPTPNPTQRVVKVWRKSRG